MARHRFVKSMNADEEYENLFMCDDDERHETQDSVDAEEFNSASANKLTLSDFISNSHSLSKHSIPKKCSDSVSIKENVNDQKLGLSENTKFPNNLTSFPTTPIKRKLTFNPDTPMHNPKIIVNKSYVEEALKFYNNRNANSRSVINLAVIGHIDAGKSTIVGNILVDFGCVSDRIISKYKKEAESVGKSSFAYAWILDETNEERKRGVTIDVSHTRLDTSKNSIVILDTPGHKDFVTKMFSGASEADAAILVLDSSIGAFEAGFHAGGQTKEHILLAKALGISQLIVVINKMDTVLWDKQRYSDIIAHVSPFLKKAGFENVKYIPCSGLLGVNLSSVPTVPNLNSWYNDLTLLDAINQLSVPIRDLQKPFRLPASNIFQINNKTSNVTGKIESGFVKVNDRIVIMPEKHCCTVSKITLNDEVTNYGFAGDQVELQLSGVDTSMLSMGSVICNLHDPIGMSSQFKARITVFDIVVPITCGFPVTFHRHSFCEQATVKKLVSIICRYSGEVIKMHPRFLRKNCWADVEISVSNPICFDLFKDVKEFGRFLLRSNNVSIAAGIITEVLP